MDFESWKQERKREFSDIRAEIRRCTDQINWWSERKGHLESYLRVTEALLNTEAAAAEHEAAPSAAHSVNAVDVTRIDLVLQVFSEDPTREWSPAEIHLELQARGLIPRDESVRKNTQSAVSRLHERDAIERIAKGRYRLRPRLSVVPGEGGSAVPA
jgi:hypothetical protein